MGKDKELSERRRIWSRISFLEKKLESKEEKGTDIDASVDVRHEDDFGKES